MIKSKLWGAVSLIIAVVLVLAAIVIARPAFAAVEKFIGTDTAGNGSTTANRLIMGRFQATQTGNITEIRVYSRASGNVKAAIYADNAGLPAARLGYNNTSTPVTAGQWNTISIPATPVTAATYYWLAAANDVSGATSFNKALGSGTSKGRTITFATFTFPATAGTRFNNYTYERAFAGWGEALASQNLIGTNTPGNGNTDANRFILGRFQAMQTGTIDEIHVYSKANGNVKVAIYTDNATSQPGDLLNANNTPTAVIANQWNTISLPPTSITAGTFYWLAAANDVPGALSFNKTVGSGTSIAKNIDFATFNFPDHPACGNFAYERAFSGWGNP